MRHPHGVLTLLLGIVLFVKHPEAFLGPAVLPSCSSRTSRAARSPGLLRMQSAVEVDSIEQAQSIILSAAESRDQDPDTVIEAIRLIERKGGSKKPAEGDANGNSGGSEPKFGLLTNNGNWRLIFTTGDMKTQKKIGGKISYVPIKAVQVFNPDYTITNGVYLGSFPLLKFSGTFTWAEEKARLEFTFDQVGVLGLTFPYKQGESKVQPGFTFMDISDRYVIARGAGGGLALWLRQDTV
eukprot:jgi/Undpi1/4809/HiC_scaffold_19.g08162.m1